MYLLKITIILLLLTSCDVNDSAKLPLISAHSNDYALRCIAEQCENFLRVKYGKFKILIPHKDLTDSLMSIGKLTIKLDSFLIDEIDERILFFYNFYDSASDQRGYYYQNDNLQIVPIESTVLVRSQSNLLLGVYELYNGQYIKQYVTNTNLLDYQILSAIQQSDSSKYIDAIIYNSLKPSSHLAPTK
jgi:hypothetical protein